MLTVMSPAQARKAHHHTPTASSVAPEFCGDRYCPNSVSVNVAPTEHSSRPDANGNEAANTKTRNYRGRQVWDRISIPTPAGTWRVAKSCGQRLSAYWNLGSGLDATSTWPAVFPRVLQPGLRVAVYTPGHIMGVIGGQEGAWRLVSFNGDGHHGNVAFTMASLRGFTLLDTTARRTTITNSANQAKRHYVKRHHRTVHMAAYHAGAR
jgi:hypothetical protein